MCTWIPNIVLGQFQRNEQLCLLITEPIRDLHKGNGTYLYWLSRSTSGLDANDADDDIMMLQQVKVFSIYQKGNTR